MNFLFTKKIFILISVFSLFIFLLHTYFTKTAIFADGKFYYAITRSIVKDADIRYENEYKELEIGVGYTKTGYVWNKYPPGTSLFWLPGFIMADGFVNTFNFLPFLQLNNSGFSVVYQTFIAASSMLLGILGLFLIYLLLKKYFTEKIALLAVIGLFGSTNLLFYIAVEPINSHAVSFFASALFIYYFINHSFNRHPEPESSSGEGSLYSSNKDSSVATLPLNDGNENKYYFFLGILGGIVALVRTQDAVILILPIIYILTKHRENFHYLTTSYLLLATGFFIAFIPQILFWKTIFGTIRSPYTDEGFSFLDPKILHVLFNTDNGLLIFTPIIVIAVLGLFLLRNRLPKIGLYGLIYFFHQLYLISSWSGYSQGGSYSIRMIISTYPLLVFGIAQIIKKVNQKISIKSISAFILILSGINFAFIIRYLLLF